MLAIFQKPNHSRLFQLDVYVHSETGLTSFEHPKNKMKAMPRIDSEGVICGANFKVDACSKISSIPICKDDRQERSQPVVINGGGESHYAGGIQVWFASRQQSQLV